MSQNRLRRFSSEEWALAHPRVAALLVFATTAPAIALIAYAFLRGPLVQTAVIGCLGGAFAAAVYFDQTKHRRTPRRHPPSKADRRPSLGRVFLGFDYFLIAAGCAGAVVAALTGSVRATAAGAGVAFIGAFLLAVHYVNNRRA